MPSHDFLVARSHPLPKIHSIFDKIWEHFMFFLSLAELPLQSCPCQVTLATPALVKSTLYKVPLAKSESIFCFFCLQRCLCKAALPASTPITNPIVNFAKYTFQSCLCKPAFGKLPLHSWLYKVPLPKFHLQSLCCLRRVAFSHLPFCCCPLPRRSGRSPLE